MANILVVDDHSDFRVTLNAMLDTAGHTVTAGRNGQEALDILASGRYDVLVLDILMPDVDGIEVLRAIGELSERPPVIAISGGGGIPASLALSLASTLGAQTVLFKPFYRQELLDAVDAALAKATTLH